MNSNPKRMTISDLGHGNTPSVDSGNRNGQSVQSDGEVVRREPKTTGNGHDSDTLKKRTDVFLNGQLRSSQG